MTERHEYNPTRSRAYAMRSLAAYVRAQDAADTPTEPDIIPVVWPGTPTTSYVLYTIALLLAFLAAGTAVGALLRLWVGA